MKDASSLYDNTKTDNEGNPIVELKNWGGHRFAPAKPGDVGHDLHVVIEKQTKLEQFVSEILGHPLFIVWPFQTKTFNTGIAVSQPNSVWCQITARSSSARKHLLVFSGIIDSGYQGELFAVMRNLSLKPLIIKEGERYAQAIFYNAVRPTFRRVVEFSERTKRADTGFGSSGR